MVVGNNYGSVYAFNYTIDSFFGNPAGYMAGALFNNHDFTGMNLFEGNDVNQVNSDNIHGTSNLATFFRNRIRGWDSNSGSNPSNATWALNMMAYNRFSNLVGNVLGTAGVQTVYQELAAAGVAQCSSSSSDIFLFGWKTGCVNGGVGSIVDDPLTGSSSVRWGNYDTVTSTSRFNCSEVDPAGSVPYSNANPCPSSQALPTSFYLNSRPSWWATAWGTPAWPASGPDVTGGNASGANGHANNIPAQLCYTNSSIDSNYPGAADRGVLMFNANSCYTQQSTATPAPPTNVTISVQ